MLFAGEKAASHSGPSLTLIISVVTIVVVAAIIVVIVVVVVFIRRRRRRRLVKTTKFKLGLFLLNNGRLLISYNVILPSVF